MITPLEIEKIRESAILHHDKELSRFCISCKDISGGPVISADSEMEAWKRFDEALNISVAFKNIEDFSLAYEGLD